MELAPVNYKFLKKVKRKEQHYIAFPINIPKICNHVYAVALHAIGFGG